LIGWQNFQHDFRARSIYRFLVWKISLPCHANIEDFGFCVSVHYFSWLWISTEMTNKVVRLFFPFRIEMILKLISYWISKQFTLW
jgi:hypothetical protein